MSERLYNELVPSDHVKAIQDSVKTELIACSPEGYLTRPVHLPPPETLPAPIAVASLAGLCEGAGLYSNNEIEVLHVRSADKVAALSPIIGRHNQRAVMFLADAHALYTPFTFGGWYPHEGFMIGLATLFEPTEALTGLISLLGNLTEEDIRILEDDGMTQEVVVKSAVHLKSAARVPNPVTLKPYRTFREIDQPESSFIVRLKRQEGRLPQCALFTTDGGAWQIEAVKSIKAFLVDACKGMSGGGPRVIG